MSPMQPLIRDTSNVLLSQHRFFISVSQASEKSHGPCEIPRDANGPDTGRKTLCPWQDDTTTKQL